MVSGFLEVSATRNQEESGTKDTKMSVLLTQTKTRLLIMCSVMQTTLASVCSRDKLQLRTLTEFRSVSFLYHVTCYQLFFDCIVRLVWLPIFCIWTKHDTYICLERSHRLISFIRVKVKSTWKPGRWGPSRTSHDNKMINVTDLYRLQLCFWCCGWSSVNVPSSPQSHTPAHALCLSVTVNMLDNCSACLTAQCTVQVRLRMKNDKNIVSPNISASCSNSWGHIYVAVMICLYFRCCHW